MTTRHPRLIPQALFVFVLGMSVTLIGAARAHDVSQYYPLKWSGAQQTWKIGNTYGAVANQVGWTSITASDDPWNAVSGSTFDFVYGGRVNTQMWTGDACTMPSPRAWVITWDVSPLGRIGNTHNCGTPTNLTATTIHLDDDANWYVSSGTPQASQYDLRSVTIHEFGHSTGFHGPNDGHFPASDTVCTTSPIHTMCAGVSPGTIYMRTLETHEKGLFSAAY